MLITAGEDVKAWDMNTFALKKQYNSHNSSLSCVSWTPDYKVDRFVVITDYKVDRFIVITDDKVDRYT